MPSHVPDRPTSMFEQLLPPSLTETPTPSKNATRAKRKHTPSSSSSSNNKKNQSTKKTKGNGYTAADALDFVLNKGLTVPETLRATMNVCSKQYLYRVLTLKKREMDLIQRVQTEAREKNTSLYLPAVEGVEEYSPPPPPSVVETNSTGREDNSTSPYNSTVVGSYPSVRKKRKGRKQSFEDRVRLMEKKKRERERQNKALEIAVKLWNYSIQIRKETDKDKDYILKQTALNSNWQKPMTAREIVAHVNKHYLQGAEKPLSKTTMVRYYQLGLTERQTTMKPKISLTLLNTMRLHIRIQQMSRQTLMPRSLIKEKLLGAVSGTQHDGFCVDWAWQRIRDLWPAEVISVQAIQTGESTGATCTTVSEKEILLALVKEYEDAKIMLRTEGFNVDGVFDASVPPLPSPRFDLF